MNLHLNTPYTLQYITYTSIHRYIILYIFYYYFLERMGVGLFIWFIMPLSLFYLLYIFLFCDIRYI